MGVTDPSVQLRDWAPPEAYVRRFRRRSMRLFLMAALILLTIFGLLAFGALVFVNASGIAARDLSRGATGDVLGANLKKQRLESEIAFLRKTQTIYRQQFEVAQRHLLEVALVDRKLNAAEGQLRLVESKLETYAATGVMPDLSAFDELEELVIARETLKEDLAILGRFQEIHDNIPNRAESESQTIDGEQSETAADLRYVERRIAALEASLASEAKKASDAPGALDRTTIQIIQTNITRFGTLILVFFFIRIMSPIYRYFVTLGTVYSGHADALVLMRQTGQEDFGSLVAAMTPKLGFGKAPSTPVDNTLQLVKELAPMLARR